MGHAIIAAICGVIAAIFLVIFGLAYYLYIPISLLSGVPTNDFLGIGLAFALFTFLAILL